MYKELSSAEMPMRNVINALTLKFQNLSDDDVVRLTHAVELERRTVKAPDKWQAVLTALRPRLNDIRPPRIPSLTRQFFMPVEDLLVTGRRGTKRLGQIDRSSLMPLWNWLQTSSAAQVIETAQSHFLKDGSQPRPEEIETILQPLRKAASGAMFRALNEAENDTRKLRHLAASVGGPQALEDFKELALALSVSDQLLGLQAQLEASFSNVTDQHIEIARSSFYAIDQAKPEASYLVPMLFLGRLTQPWEVLRLASAVSRLHTEELLMSTDFRFVCDRLLDLLRDEQTQFDEAQDTQARKLIVHLRSFVDIYSGISHVMPIKKQSELGRQLLECRNKFADQIATRVKRLSRFIDESIPEAYMAPDSSDARASALELPNFAELTENVSAMADFLVEVSRLSHRTNLYFGIDQDVRHLNAALDKRLIALTLAYRQRGSIPKDALDHYYTMLETAFCKLSGSEAVDRLKTVKPS